MKKSLILGVLGLVAGAASSFGAGYIRLDNYNSFNQNGGPPVTYGVGVPANGVSGPLGTAGVGLLDGWTVGIYYAPGTLNITDPFSLGIPDAQLALATGPGSTVSIYTTAGNTPGEFSSSLGLNVAGNAGDIITAEIVVYDTASGSYANAIWRAHSAPFTMPTASSINPSYPLVGDYFSAFSVTTIPEPSTLALAGLGGLSLWLLRRRK